MDKFTFINRIIALYPHAITNKEAQFDIYNRVLPSNDKADYEQLMDIFAEEYKDTFPPPAALLKEMAQRCLRQETVTASKWIHVKVYNPIYKAITNNDVFPAGTSEEKIITTYKKMFPGSDGWQLIEVY